MKNLLRDQPLLVGCGASMLVIFLACGAGLGLVARGCGAASEKLGVQSLPATISAASRAGFGLGIQSTTDEGLIYSMEPQLPREVTCEELFEVLGPQLAPESPKIVIRSVSTSVEKDGSALAVPVECTWAGVPVPGASQGTHEVGGIHP
ncbi:MAG TPA: hypothetical protein DIU15_03385 [Deltaproteobacteria bacterium]|nr:hypothetical protein [Deltaproteobacteria bacterium]HCP45055.1 hypothetical protein [Deltaproteobacteria bacterium]